MNVTIARGTLKDVDTITKLFDLYMIFYKKPSDKSRYKAYLEERLKNKEATIFIAYDDKKIPLGFVLNYYSFSSVSLGKIIVLNDLFVQLEYRKNGIAEKLINKTFELAKEEGAVRVDLGTAKDNYAAQRLYKKIGFIKDEEFYGYSYHIA
ncbi:GNAT family N-acetyltransferase [Aquimarina addita]|uniref:GNAT family N-acetyltransferase n=1 Tax=Aquimarina addita TaxID=870485 RepID=A0ABP7XFI4_9FLAO